MIKNISVLLMVVVLIFSLSNNPVHAASDIDGPTVIHKEANQIFTINNLLSMYDSDVFVESDGYTGQGNLPGEYTITLSQGFNTKDVTVVVVENWNNLQESNDLLYVTDYKDIYVSNDRVLTLYEIIYYIYDVTGYVVSEYKFMYEELINEYHSSFDEDDIIPEGSYELSFRLTYYSGEQSSYSVKINTVEIQDLPGIMLEPPPTTMDRIMSAAPWVLIIGAIFYFLTHRKKKRGFY